MISRLIIYVFLERMPRIFSNVKILFLKNLSFRLNFFLLWCGVKNPLDTLWTIWNLTDGKIDLKQGLKKRFKIDYRKFGISWWSKFFQTFSLDLLQALFFRLLGDIRLMHYVLQSMGKTPFYGFHNLLSVDVGN